MYAGGGGGGSRDGTVARALFSDTWCQISFQKLSPYQVAVIHSRTLRHTLFSFIRVYFIRINPKLKFEKNIILCVENL